jgi:hypothetical protein
LHLPGENVGVEIIGISIDPVIARVDKIFSYCLEPLIFLISNFTALLLLLCVCDLVCCMKVLTLVNFSFKAFNLLLVLALFHLENYGFETVRSLAVLLLL